MININLHASTSAASYLSKLQTTHANTKQSSSIQWNGHSYTPLANQTTKANEFVKAQ